MNTTLISTAVASLALLAGCGNDAGASPGGLSGTIAIDGSSTVFPITEAMAEEFQKIHPRVRVPVGVSGTGGGFKSFVRGETDINDASRPVKPEEAALAAENGIEYIELPIAFDGISVVVNKENSFVDHLTAVELKKIWQPGSTVKLWSDVRPGWPEEPVHLYGPGTDSGTFDYFTEAINGESKACRADFTASEDDNVLVQGVAGDRNGLGFFGYAYYAENTSRLKLVPVDGGEGPISPSMATIGDGTYQPLARPIFLYISTASAERPEVQAFIDFYLEQAPVLVREVGYVPLPDSVYELVASRFERRVTGSVFSSGDLVGVRMEDVLR